MKFEEVVSKVLVKYLKDVRHIEAESAWFDEDTCIADGCGQCGGIERSFDIGYIKVGETAKRYLDVGEDIAEFIKGNLNDTEV